MGSKNNLVSVKRSDFEVFQALAKDSESVHQSEQREWSQVKILNKNVTYLFEYILHYWGF